MRKTGEAARKTMGVQALRRPVIVGVSTGPSLLGAILIYPYFPHMIISSSTLLKLPGLDDKLRVHPPYGAFYPELNLSSDPREFYHSYFPKCFRLAKSDKHASFTRICFISKEHSQREWRVP